MFLKCFNDAAVSGIVADVLNSLYSLGSLVTLACLPQFLGIAFNTGPLHWLILCVSSTGLPSRDTQTAGETISECDCEGVWR